MIPGVTNRPDPSIVTSPTGASRPGPIASILPSTISTYAPALSSPAAVMMVAPRRTVGRTGGGVYRDSQAPSRMPASARRVSRESRAPSSPEPAPVPVVAQAARDRIPRDRTKQTGDRMRDLRWLGGGGSADAA